MRAPDEALLTHGETGPEGNPEDSGRGTGAATGAALLVARWRRLPRRPRQALAAIASLLAAAALAVVIFFLVSAEVRIVNTTGGPVRVAIDGGKPRLVANVAAESPDAGVVIRLWPGRRKVRVTTEAGDELEARELPLSASTTYLWAPANTEQCFWIEHTAYGRTKPEAPPLRMLPEGQTLWPVPAQIDGWFFPTPPAGVNDARSSGGTRTAVRQARCGLPPWK